jgi:hypothetical protein
MGVQGRSFSDETIRRIVRLLSSTEMTIDEISERMACSRSSILTINTKFHVRDYGGFRSRWRLRSDSTIDSTEKSA